MSVGGWAQKAVFERLLLNADVARLVGNRIYDGAPADPEFPYITFGPVDLLEDDAEDIPGALETLQIDIWSRAGGRTREALDIAFAVRAAIRQFQAPLPSGALAQLEIALGRVFPDEDGRTIHGVIVCEMKLEET
ncbi:MAG: DUF3168 domain-containing protein [Pseudomonadota bacterium]